MCWRKNKKSVIIVGESWYTGQKRMRYPSYEIGDDYIGFRAIQAWETKKMLKINIHTVLIALLLFFWLEPIQAADNRLALVIGNSSYQGNAFLENVVTNDARDLADALKKLNFQVIYKENLNYKDMQNVIKQFGEELRGGVGLFYFAGYGLQFYGENYLIPINAEGIFYTHDEKRLERKTIKVSDILEIMQFAENRIIILDASRKNPFQDDITATRTIQKGLTQFEVPDGTLIAYAAKPGKVVAENNPYTKHLISEIQKQDVSITQVFLRVEAVVLEETGKQQESKSYSELKVDFYFAGKSDSWLIFLFGTLIALIAMIVIQKKIRAKIKTLLRVSSWRKVTVEVSYAGENAEQHPEPTKFQQHPEPTKMQKEGSNPVVLTSKTTSLIDLSNRLRQINRAMFNDICFNLQEKYEYDLSFIEPGGAPAEAARQLVEYLKPFPQGATHLQQELKDKRLL